jgi:hypothetical protein
MQRLIEWRSDLAEAAVKANEAIFKDLTSAEVAKQVADALDGDCGDENFRYKEVLHSGIVCPHVFCLYLINDYLGGSFTDRIHHSDTRCSQQLHIQGSQD